MKMTKIISYIHLLGCIGWSIFGFWILISNPNDATMDKITAFGFFALFATTASGIYLFVIRRKKQPVSIEIPNATLMTKIISYIHFLGCVGWSIFGFYILITVPLGQSDVFLIFTIFATVASGIYLFLIRRQELIVQQWALWLWKMKKLIILWIGIVVIVAMCLFPPWVAMGEGIAGKFLGHYYLFSDQRTIERMFDDYRGRIDLIRLIVQCGIIGLITGGLLYSLKDK